MSTLYETIMELCNSRGISGYKLCKDLGISASTLSDLKHGRKKGLSADYANRIANYFGVTVDRVLYGKDAENPMTIQNRKHYSQVMESRQTMPTVEQIKFALFNGEQGITDEDYQDVKEYAALVAARRRKKNDLK